MKALCTIVLVFVIVCLNACASIRDIPRLGDSAGAEDRRLLVTFVDRTIGRAFAGHAAGGYQPRGQYGNSGWSERMAQALAERHHLRVVAQWPVTELGVSCVVYQVPGQTPLAEMIAALQGDREVASVQSMQTFQVLGQLPGSSPQGDPYLPMQAGFQALGIADWHHMATGRGIRIALIDTGVDLSHPDLSGQIEHVENLAPDPADANLADVHGTAVAGVLVARPDNGIGIAGIAPDAELIAFRACWPDKPGALAAHCNTFSLALALNQSIRMQSRIINLSLSGPDDALLKQLLERAQEKGIVIVAAVPDKGQAGGFPANLAGVIAVGRGGEGNPGEIIAPGEDILTTVPRQAYDFMTGSSFATPHVSGLAALLLQLHPDWQGRDIKRLLRSHSPLSASQLLKNVASIARQ